MIFGKRTFGVGDVETIEELAERLTETTWALCTGFRFRGLLFLNDSFTESSAQEYAVIRESDMCQLESITFSWCDKEKAIDVIRFRDQGDTYPRPPRSPSQRRPPWPRGPDHPEDRCTHRPTTAHCLHLVHRRARTILPAPAPTPPRRPEQSEVCR